MWNNFLSRKHITIFNMKVTATTTTTDINKLLERIGALQRLLDSDSSKISSVLDSDPDNKRFDCLQTLNREIYDALRKTLIKVTAAKVSHTSDPNVCRPLADEVGWLEKTVNALSALLADLLDGGGGGEVGSNPGNGPSSSPSIPKHKIPNLPPIKPSQQAPVPKRISLTLGNLESAAARFIESKPNDYSFESFLDWARANNFDISGVDESYRKKYNEIIARNGAEGSGGVSFP
jgi:hypothetical protein